MDDRVKQHVEASIRSLVAGGRTQWSYLENERVPEIIDGEQIDDPDDQAWLMDFARQTWRERLDESKHWARPTDVYKLAVAYDDLRSKGFACGGITGSAFTQSDVVDDLVQEYEHPEDYELLCDDGPMSYLGCHSQDIDRCLFGRGDLLLTHGIFGDADPESVARSAQTAVDALTEAGLSVDWNGDTNRRIALANFAWHKDLARGPQDQDAPETAAISANLSTGDIYDGLTDDALFVIFEHLRTREVEWMTVAKTADASGSTFMQTAKNLRGGWHGERREGAAASHVEATFADLDAVRSEIVGWAFGHATSSGEVWNPVPAPQPPSRPKPVQEAKPKRRGFFRRR